MADGRIYKSTHYCMLKSSMPCNINCDFFNFPPVFVFQISLGIALLPEVAVRNELQAGQLCALRAPFLQPFLQRKLWLLLHRDRYRGALLETFLRATIA